MSKLNHSVWVEMHTGAPNHSTSLLCKVVRGITQTNTLLPSVGHVTHSQGTDWTMNLLHLVMSAFLKVYPDQSSIFASYVLI